MLIYICAPFGGLMVHLLLEKMKALVPKQKEGQGDQKCKK